MPPGRRNTFNIGCKLLTSNEMRINIYNKQFEKQINSINQIQFKTYQFLYNYISEKDDVNGFNLTQFPPLLVKTFPRNYSGRFYNLHTLIIQ